MLDAERLAGDAGDEDVGVVATGDGGDGAIGRDARLGEHVAIEADTDHRRSLEVFAETSERLEPAVDHDDVVLGGG